MKTKNKLLFVLLTILLISVIPNAFAENAELTLTLNRYEPLPAQPGQYVTVYLEVENTGSADATDVAIEILDSFPFSLVSETDRIQNIGMLKSQDSAIRSCIMKVDTNAVVGINKLKVRYAPEKNLDLWMTRDLEIEVKNSDAKLAINKVEVSPSKIYPGEEGTLTLTLKNTASTAFRDLSLKLDLEETTTTDLPFIPLNSVSEKHVSLLNPGEISQLVFSIATYPTATPGYYNIPVDISFYDDEGNLQEQNDIIGVIISASPELKIVSQHISGASKNSQIRLKCINKGINDLKFLDIEILDSEEYKLISTNENYIGDLDSDDYRSADFDINSKDDEFTLIVKATFRDENNEPYTKTMDVPVKIIASKTGESNGISFGTILLILIIAGLGYYVYRLKVKPKHK